MGREAQCVYTIDSFLIQSSRPECHASEVFGVKKNQALNVGYEQVQSGLEKKNPRDSREYFLQSFRRNSVRDAKMWHCTKGKDVHKIFPERCHK